MGRRVGSLIVFEGVDGVGKTTLSKLVRDHICSQNLPCQYRAFPGREPGTLGHHIYELHHHPKNFGVAEIDPLSLQTLHIAAHIDEITGRIKPLLESGVHVILDRFWWSTLVYGKVAGAREKLLQNIIKAEIETWKPIVPLAAFLITATESHRGADDEHSQKKWQTISEYYRTVALSQQRNHPVFIIENNGLVEDTPKSLSAILDPLLGISDNAPSMVRESVRGEQPVQLMLTPAAVDTQVRTRAVVHSRISPAIPTQVFDTYWRFAAERQEVFFRRLEEQEPPWTADPIIAMHKFTNAYRASDRVSQYLIRNVIYTGEQSVQEVFFRTLLFKIFNRIETWEMLLEHFKSINFGDYSFERYDAVLTSALEAGNTIFSAAYIMPSGSTSFGNSKKHRNYLRLLEKMMADEVPQHISSMRKMREAFECLRAYPMMGDFLAYQFVIDINYSNITQFSEMEFVVPGPGARDGIKKCFTSLGGLSEADIIRVMADRQEEEFERLGIKFRSLWGRPLQLIDCQNLFCEVDKYARVAHPEVQGVSGRTRIKQKFLSHKTSITPWYPPKWGINDRIQGS